MSTDIKINRPTPIDLTERPAFYDANSNLVTTMNNLEEGKVVLIRSFYSNGLNLLKELHVHLKKKLPNTTYQEQQVYRDTYRKMSHLILLEIVQNQLEVKKAPSIGWLEKLYPDVSEFHLPLPLIQGLNSSWQWFKKGISIPVLRNKIHPYYGVYFPTRFEHLEVFDTYLERYEGPKKAAFDVGTGSGVLALQLLKYSFQKVFATDVNPNAIIGLTEYMGDTKLSRKIELDHAPLFGKFDQPAELIVFNPPWLPASQDVEGLDQAIYYKEDLFPSFFEGAKERLAEGGKLVILFSNIAEITEVTKEHPIEKELAENDRFQLERCFKKRVNSASEKTKRDPHWRDQEEVELWELQHK